MHSCGKYVMKYITNMKCIHNFHIAHYIKEKYIAIRIPKTLQCKYHCKVLILCSIYVQAYNCTNVHNVAFMAMACYLILS